MKILSFNNGGSGTKYLPCSLSYGKLVNAKGFFLVSNFGVEVLAAIVEVSSFLQEKVKGFFTKRKSRRSANEEDEKDNGDGYLYSLNFYS